jgi:collagenase-like PrtC family protease
MSITKEDAIQFRNFVETLGVDFVYLLNAPFNDTMDSKKSADLSNYLCWVLKDLEPDGLTISSHDLMQHVRRIDNTIPIHISTIAGVKNLNDLQQFMDVLPNRLVPHHDIGKNFKDLAELTKFGKENNMEVEILATESCLFGCPNRKAHYEYLSNKKADNPFHTICNSKKLIRPREFLLAGGVIRPEDVNFYKNLGVNYIKISGRSKPSSWITEVVKAYHPSLEAEKWIYLNNKALDGFLENFPTFNDYEARAMYCDKWMIKLYKSGDFRLMDGSTYKTDGQSLVLNKPGDYVQSIIKKEE